MLQTYEGAFAQGPGLEAHGMNMEQSVFHTYDHDGNSLSLSFSFRLEIPRVRGQPHGFSVSTQLYSLWPWWQQWSTIETNGLCNSVVIVLQCASLSRIYLSVVICLFCLLTVLNWVLCEVYRLITMKYTMKCSRPLLSKGSMPV